MRIRQKIKPNWKDSERSNTMNICRKLKVIFSPNKAMRSVWRWYLPFGYGTFFFSQLWYLESTQNHLILTDAKMFTKINICIQNGINIYKKSDGNYLRKLINFRRQVYKKRNWVSYRQVYTDRPKYHCIVIDRLFNDSANQPL